MLCFGVSDLIYKRGAAAGINAGEFLMAAGLDFLSGRDALCVADRHARSASVGAVGRARRLVSIRRALQFHPKPAGRRGQHQCADLPAEFHHHRGAGDPPLGEPLTVAKALALACALVAVWLLLAEAGGERGKLNLASLGRVLLATVAMAFTNLFYKVGLQQGAVPETMVAAQAWIFCSLATLFGFLRERRV